MFKTLGVCAVLTLSATPAYADNADWMAQTFADRPGTALSAIVIPGTHDSGAFKIDTKGKCKVTPIAGLNPVIANAGKGNPCAAGKLAKAQNNNLGRQLRDGIRYLDMRVGVPANKVIKPSQANQKLNQKKAAKVPLFLHHSFISQKLAAGLKDVMEFARAHPREQLILDFQHIDLTGKKKVDKYYKRALDILLGDRVCSRAWTKSAVPVADDQLAGVTLEQAWAANRNVLVLYAAGELPTGDCYRSREKALYSPWPNTESPEISATKNTEYLVSRRSALADPSLCPTGVGNQCGLFVNQLQLSLQFGTQAACLAGNTGGRTCSLLQAAKTRNPTVGPEMTQRRQIGLPVNIAIVDFYELNAGAYVRDLLALNQP